MAGKRDFLITYEYDNLCCCYIQYNFYKSILDFNSHTRAGNISFIDIKFYIILCIIIYDNILLSF